MTLGERVDDFTAQATGGPFRLADHGGEAVVLYFYPKDNTPGCTTEGQQFRDLSEKQEGDQQSAANNPEKKHQHRDNKNPVAPARNTTRSGVVVSDDLIVARV